MKDLIALLIIFTIAILPLTIIPIPIHSATNYTWVYYEQYLTPKTLLVPILWEYNGNGTNAQVSLVSTTTLNYPFYLYEGFNVWVNMSKVSGLKIPTTLSTGAYLWLCMENGIAFCPVASAGASYQFVVADTINSYYTTLTNVFSNGKYYYYNTTFLQTIWNTTYTIKDLNSQYGSLTISNPQYFDTTQINFPLIINTYGTQEYNLTYAVLTNIGTITSQITRFNYPNVLGILVPNLETILNGLGLPFQASKGANVSVLPAYFKTRMVLAIDNYTSFAIAGLGNYNVSIYTTSGQYLTSYYPNANIYTASFSYASGFYYVCISSGNCNPNQISSTAPIEYVYQTQIVYQNQTVYVPINTALDVNFLIYASFIFFFLIAVFYVIRRFTQ